MAADNLVERVARATFMRNWVSTGGMSEPELFELRKKTDRDVWKMHLANARAALAVAGPAIRERCAAYVDCGCPHGPEAVQAAKQFGHNSAQRWKICGESICAALEAHEIRSMTDE
jgi:hypothetical protein